jgi:prepilin peptidase CpaA
MVTKIILLVILLISFYTDVKSRKILNIVTLPAILFAFVYYLSFQGLDGFLFSGKGFLVGLGLLILPYMLGGMGAGDVKLMASIGALMGTSFVFYSFIYTALIGGLIAVALIIKQKGFVNTIKTFLIGIVFIRSNLGSIHLVNGNQSSISFPYGIAIVLGSLCSLIWGGF